MLVKHAVTPAVQLELLQPGDRVKTAGAMPAVQDVLSRLKPEAAYTYALVNAMGYSEYYGTNSNADWYGHCEELDFNGLLHAWPDIGHDLETDRMKGRDWPYGYPCFYGATVYAHHKNTSPTQLGFGDVRYVFANPIMKRVELLMRIHNEEARKKGHLNIVERIQAGERCDVSMGAKICWDLCSICTDWDAVRKAWKTFDPQRHRHQGMAVLEQHKKKPIRGLAVVSSDYCQHIKTQRNQVLPDGRRAFMHNVFPRFFDISCVFIGADRTARVMWHLSSSYRDDAPIPQPMRAARLSIEDLFHSKVASKHAELDKEVPGVVEKVFRDSDSAPEFRFDQLGKDPRSVLSSTAALGIVLSPPEFQRLLGGEPGSFSTATSKIDDSLAVGSRFMDADLLSALKSLVPERSGFRPFVGPRISSISLKIDLIAPEHDHADDKLAALYNGYRLSLLDSAEKLASRARSYLVSEELGAKTAVHPLAALLLGAAPMLHLVAAHLRKTQDEGRQLGTMASLLADNPTFISLAVLGAGIRIAMAAESGGLLPAALRLIGASTKTG